MKHLLTAALATAAIVGSAFTASADVYNLELDTPLSLPAKSGEIYAVFTAPESGTLTVTTDTSTQFAIYSPYEEGKEYSMDEEVDPQYPHTTLSWWPWSVRLDVEAGNTYLFLVRGYLYSPVVMTATMGTAATEVVSIDPTPNGILPITGSVQLGVKFNSNAIDADKCVVSSGNNSVELEVISYNGDLIVNYPSHVYGWLVDDQTIQPGDEVKFTISGITEEGKIVETAKYGDQTIVTDGEMILTYEAPDKPTTFISCSKPDGSTFMSYYNPGDEEGIFKYTFSGPVQIEPGNVMWRYGNAELEGNGYADGTIPFSIVDNVVHVNATGVMRNMAELAPDAPSGMPIYVYLYQVKDMQGNYIYSPN